MDATHNCVIFDENKFNGKDVSNETEKKVEAFCGGFKVRFLLGPCTFHSFVRSLQIVGRVMMARDVSARTR